MLLVSCRANFDDTDTFGGQDLQIRDYPALTCLSQFTALPSDDLWAAVHQKHVLVLVHGFNNTLADVAGAYGDLESRMRACGLLGPGGYDLIVGFLWPGFKGDLGFFRAIPSANRAAAYLRDLLTTLNASAHTVDLQTHSLGARVGLQALSFRPEVFVDNLLLTAPAVDDEVLEPKREFTAALQSCNRCWVYHSVNDPVLKTAYRLAELDCALGWHGPQDPPIIAAQCPDVFLVDCAAVVTTHGGYRSSAPVLDQWARVLSSAPLPRVETLTTQTLQQGSQPV